MAGSPYLDKKPDAWFLSVGGAQSVTEAARNKSAEEGRRVDRSSFTGQLKKRGLAQKLKMILALNAQGKAEEALEVAEAVAGADSNQSEPVEEQQLTRDSSGNTDTLEAKGIRIKTLEDLLEAADVDLEVFFVKRHVVNKWENFSAANGITELFQVKAWLERKQEAIDLLGLRDAAIEAMKAHSPAPVRRYKVAPKTGLAMDILAPDLHLGKLAHAEETGENYDGKLAVAAFRHVLYGLLTHAQNMKVSRLIFPVGHDLLHVDSAENETTAGTRQDTDGRWYKSTRRAVDLMVEAIDAMAQIAPVDVVVVPGNHARMAEGMLGEVLRAWYRLEDRITLYDSPAPRKYLEHGSNLLGFTHGDGVKAADLPLLMATEAPEMWARTRYRVWNTGHLHQRKADRFGSIQEHKGVEVRISPSLSGSDSWHAGKGFIGNLRAAESHVYDEASGEIARFRATLPEDYEAA